MSFTSILDTLIFMPLRLLFEVVFIISNKLMGDVGLSIIVLSLAINLLVLPLYNRADAMQEEERETEKRLNPIVKHIKKTFTGDERTMMLQAYYRQNNYSPLGVLKGAVSLFLEIPFFIAAYGFLSSLDMLNGASLGTISDLSRPDGLLVLFGITINVLPIIMTAVNLVSSAIFTKGHPLKAKLQLYGMALFFLILLYDSPSGLVFYWTLNNVFSLIKTIIIKLKPRGKRLAKLVIPFAAIFFLLAIYCFFIEDVWQRGVFCTIAFAVLALIAFFSLRKDTCKAQKAQKTYQPDAKVFFVCSLLAALTVGLLVPISLIKSSPQEFVIILNNEYKHPLWYVLSAILLSLGTFVLWFGVFYKLASNKAKVHFERTSLVLAVTALVNSLFFGNSLGTISSDLIFDNGLSFSLIEIIVNSVTFVGILVLLIILFNKIKKYVTRCVAVLLAAIICISGYYTVSICTSISTVTVSAEGEKSTPTLTLSKTGKNVVVIMLDRAMGLYLPYILNEDQSLYERLDGFTYYNNVISFGGHTNFAAPALFGGYEYTPEEMNKRDTVALVDKHNEALKVMPVIFENAGYDVTVCDPPYAGYQAVPDLSIFDDYPNIRKFNTMGAFTRTNTKEERISNRFRNFFCYGITKSSPIGLQYLTYNNGVYNQLSETHYVGQTMQGTSIATGLSNNFVDSYSVLEAMSSITVETANEKGSFIMLANETTHEPNLLSEPSYTPVVRVDNTEYDNSNQARFTVDGVTLTMNTPNCMRFYHSNMAAIKRLADWFDYLRENGMYDNTRIIITSDHGYGLGQSSDLLIDTFTDAQYYYPLLLVKDFNATGFTTDSTFMTNADVPTLATSGVIENAVNPFTGNPINMNEKYAHPQHIITSHNWYTANNSKTTYNASGWLTVSNSIWDKSNWKKQSALTKLPE